MFSWIKGIIDRYTKYCSGQVQERYIRKSLKALKEKKQLTREQKKEIPIHYGFLKSCFALEVMGELLLTECQSLIKR